jgi:AcrR family transcriptional regulator
VRRQLQEAAVELFLEKGFDRTTAAEIAARAEVTERTFFRYFPDKRDVLFDEAELHTQLGAAIAEAPSALGPLDMVAFAFTSTVPLFENNRPLSEPGQKVIAQTPALQERQLTKTAAVTATMAEALCRRGIGGSQANLAAATGMAVAVHALRAWFEDSSEPLFERFEETFRAMKELVASQRGRETH